MEPQLKKFKRPTDFSIRSLIDSNTSIETSSHTSSPNKSISNESLQYSPSSSSTGTTPASTMFNRLSWSQVNSRHWLPDADIIDKARTYFFRRISSQMINLMKYSRK